MQNERGRYFSEGKFEILGYPRTTAMTPWTGFQLKVGLTTGSAQLVVPRPPNGNMALRL
jgi:hypothetical protein